MIALSTSSLKGYWLHKIFSFARKAWFQGITLDINPLEFDTFDAGYLLSLIAEFQLPVLSVQAFERRMDMKWFWEIQDLCLQLGAKVVHFYPPHRLDKDVSWFTQWLLQAKSDSRFEKRLIFSILNVEPKTILFFIPEYKDATLASIKKVTGSTTLSISQVNSETGVDLMKTFTLLGSSISHVIVGDKTATKWDLLPGTGEMPLESFFVKLKNAGYSGDFTLRIAPKELGVGDDAQVLRNLESARKYLEAHIGNP